jgi:hypothetical protein
MKPARGGLSRLFPAALVAVVIAFGLYLDHAASFDEPTEVAMKEPAMNPAQNVNQEDTTHAKHGPRSEVTWEGGSGRQPYANQGEEEAAEPGAGETAEGNRGDKSGRNLDQLEEARRKP